MSGKLYAIGTGPGAADLITVRAAKILGSVDIVYAPAARKGEGTSLALSIIREYISNGTEVKERLFPMTSDIAKKEEAWLGVAQEIASDINAGKEVAFVSLGDVMLYSTWVSVFERLPKGVDIEIIPGITSFALIAAKTQRPLVMDTQSLAIVPCTAPKEEIDQALVQHSCLVLMKAGTRFSELKKQIEAHKLLNYAVLVSDASLESEKRYTNLADVPESERLPYFSTILINKEWAV